MDLANSGLYCPGRAYFQQLFSFNDFISNGGIIIAAVIVMLTGANWPDLVVGIAVAGIAIYGGIDILRDAHMDGHDERGTVHGKKRE